ncbi:MAG: SxtJ family membrane protein [Paracoccaceae bacterium]
MTDVSGHTDIRLGSDRSFGLVIAGVMVVIAVFPMLWGHGLRWWPLPLVLAFGGTALIRPDALHGLNVLWFKFGLLLGKIITPIVMGILFFVTVVPIGLIRRIGNKDPLNQAIDTQADSYWVPVTEERRKMSSMKQQF